MIFTAPKCLIPSFQFLFHVMSKKTLDIIILSPSYIIIFLISNSTMFLSFFLFFFFLSFVLLLRAAPAACGGSQASGRIEAAVASLHHSHSTARSEPHLQLTPQLMAMPDP